jgi:fatty acid synthase
MLLTFCPGKLSKIFITKCNIAGVKDPSTVNQDISLGELGLDSLMGVEIKQALERIINVDLPIKAIRLLNFKKLCELEYNIAEVIKKPETTD